MNVETLIYIGGIYHLGWALFDSFWPIIFNWKETLASLDDLNRILLPITSKLLVVVYLAISYISFFHTSELSNTGIGKTILVFVSLYWSVRAIMQIYYFGFEKANEFNITFTSFAPFLPIYSISNKSISYGLLLYFFFGIALYLIPLSYILC